MTQSSQPGRQPKFTNRLIHETSPYLRQHAHNPVDWYPWGSEALETARGLDKPILLSIGYSACHWCHVMERESFENESIASTMNEFFVNIKVDREERPDLDTIYMNYVQMTTGSGGWPMTVFLTPDQVPFFGGTYFPPDDRYGRPGFPRLCSAVNEAYKTRKSEIVASGADIVEALQKLNTVPERGAFKGIETMTLAFQNLSQRFDWVNGGFSGAPKFPPSMSLAFCLRHSLRTHERAALDFVQLTLTKMASGGMYDQLGGGFHRYSVDDRWLVPHFEKMLYDNALLSRVYLEAFQYTGKQGYRRIVEEVLDYVKREMTDPRGGFYSSQDADSDGEEGKFFVWTPDEIISVLGAELGELFCSSYDVTRRGNFEGKNILNIPRSLEEIAKEAGSSLEGFKARLNEGRRQLFAQREERIKPHRDDKILASWNGLMLVSFALAGRVLNCDDFLQTARENASFILQHMTQGGKLFRVYKEGQTRILGYLEDYSNFVEGLLTLYEVTGESDWLEQARILTDSMLRQFWDTSESSFFLAGNEHEQLITRVKDFYDNATPAGSSVAVLNLLRLSILTGKHEYREVAEANLESMATALSHHPGGFSYLLLGVDFIVGPVREFAVVGEKRDSQTQELVNTIFQEFMPKKVLAYSAGTAPEQERLLPLLKGKGLVDGNPAVYVCENFQCKAPVTSQEELKDLFKKVAV